VTDRHSRREITHRPARVRGATHRPDPRKALPLRRGGLRTVARQTNAQTRSPRCRAPRRPRRAQRRRRRRTMATRLRGRRHTHRSVHGRRTRCAREGRRRPLAIPVASGLEAPGQTLPNTTLNHESSRRRLDLRPRDRAGCISKRSQSSTPTEKRTSTSTSLERYTTTSDLTSRTQPGGACTATASGHGGTSRSIGRMERNLGVQDHASAGAVARLAGGWLGSVAISDERAWSAARRRSCVCCVSPRSARKTRGHGPAQRMTGRSTWRREQNRCRIGVLPQGSHALLPMRAGDPVGVVRVPVI